MDRVETNYTTMTRKPVGRLIASLAIPNIVSMLVTAVYNMADTFFVSRLGTSAAGAVGIVFSLMAMEARRTGRGLLPLSLPTGSCQ